MRVYGTARGGDHLDTAYHRVKDQCQNKASTAKSALARGAQEASQQLHAHGKTAAATVASTLEKQAVSAKAHIEHRTFKQADHLRARTAEASETVKHQLDVVKSNLADAASATQSTASEAARAVGHTAKAATTATMGKASQGATRATTAAAGAAKSAAANMLLGTNRRFARIVESVQQAHEQARATTRQLVRATVVILLAACFSYGLGTGLPRAYFHYRLKTEKEALKEKARARVDGKTEPHHGSGGGEGIASVGASGKRGAEPAIAVAEPRGTSAAGMSGPYQAPTSDDPLQSRSGSDTTSWWWSWLPRWT